MNAAAAELELTIVAGGWSVRAVDLTRLRGQVIAVNEAAVLLPRWDYAVSMDRLWTEHRIDHVISRSAEHLPRPEIWLRRSAVQNLNVTSWPWVKVFACDHLSSIFTSKPLALNGRNSGFCALNLAWKLRPRRLYLLGFDMVRSPRGETYWHEPYSWGSPTGGTSDGKYESWAASFKGASTSFRRISCEVMNVSPASAIAEFKKITPEEYYR
jgi:hypothetical protein